METVCFVLRDDQWAKMEPHCLGKPSDPSRSGGDNRLFVEAVLWIALTGTDLTPSFPPAGIRAGRLLHCYPTLDHSGLEFSAFPRSGVLVSPAEFANMIGGIFPIALCGRSSL